MITATHPQRKTVKMATQPETTRAIKPTIGQRANQPICPNCGGKVERRNPKGPFPTFCDQKGAGVCKREHANLLLVQGRAVIGLLKGWRIDRGSGEIAQKAFAQICQITDQFNAEDAAAGMPRADLYAAKLMANSSLYMDRQRRR